MKEIKINKGILIIAVFVALIGCFFIGKGISDIRNRAERENALNGLISAYNDSIKIYKTKIGDLEYTVAQKEEAIIGKDLAISASIVTQEKYRKLYLKSIEHNTSLQAYVNILLDSIKNTNSSDIYFITEEDSTPCVRLPYDWVYNDPWLTAVGHVDETAETTLKLDMGVELDIVIGRKKISGAPLVSVLENNPHFNVTNIKSVRVEDKKWYDSPWVKYGLGVATGVGIMMMAR